MNNSSKGTKTNGETFMELLGKMRLYMETPPHFEQDGYDISMRFSREWWNKPVGHRRCAQCGEWFEAKRMSHIYCEKCAGNRKREAQRKSHNTELHILYKRVYGRMKHRGEDTSKFSEGYKYQKNNEEKMRFVKKWDEKTKRKEGR